MFRNYLKVACRNLYKNKALSNINILGLALGIGCSMLIFLWIKDELAIDAFHEHSAQLYTIYETQHHDGIIDAGPYTPGMLFEELKSLYPEVKYAVPMASWTEERTFESIGKILKQKGVYAGPDFFSAFSYSLLFGQAELALRTTSDIAISRKMAMDFFGSPEAAVGQLVRFENLKDLRVSAVFDDVTDKSSLKFDYVLNWETFLEQHSWARDWGNNGPATYVVLQPDADVKAFGKKIHNFLAEKHSDSQSKNFVINLHLQKFNEGYLHSRFENGEIVGGRIQYVKLFAFVALFILLIAAINFMNLTTARSLRRSREIGVRKVVGAIRMSLVRQFLGESMLTAFLAFSVAILIVVALLPSFNAITQKHIVLPSDFTFWSLWVTILTVTGLVSGCYPALYLSSFNPVKAFKGALRFTSGAIWFRRSLVVFQFALSIMLIIGTIVISRQVRYVQTAQLGYDRENLLFIPMEGDLPRKYETFKNLAYSVDGVKAISCISNNPTSINNGTGGVVWEGKDPDAIPQFTQAAIGLDFIKTMHMEMLQGREFSNSFASDSTAYIVNEEALKLFGYSEPIGMPLTFWGRKGTIVGVVKNFHFNSMHEAIRPLVLRLVGNSGSPEWVVVRVEAGMVTAAIQGLEKICRELNPKFPFAYQFSDEQYKKLYTSEMVVEKLSNAFAALAIFISCLGLLGLTIFAAEQRTKEIGIRKVLGASMSSLFGLLSKELLLLVLIALTIASPLAWFVMNDWLSEYAYRTELVWWIFPVAGCAAIAIALGAVSFQTIKSLLVNPVNSLRSE